MVEVVEIAAKARLQLQVAYYLGIAGAMGQLQGMVVVEVVEMVAAVVKLKRSSMVEVVEIAETTIVLLQSLDALVQ